MEGAIGAAKGERRRECSAAIDLSFWCRRVGPSHQLRQYC